MYRQNRTTAAASFALAAAVIVGCGQQVPSSPVGNVRTAMALREEFDLGAPAAAAETAVAGTPTGWATLKGKFTLTGTPPARAREDITGDDKERCAPGGKTVLRDDIIVGSDGAVANVAIFLVSNIADDEPWTHPSQKPGKSTEVVFDQKECRFLTRVMALQASQPVLIKNSDAMGHNTNIVNGGFDQVIPANGGTQTYKFKGAANDPFRVKCAIHPWMTGWMLPRRNSYFSLSSETGEFEIAKLPAGVPLQFSVWHERTRGVKTATVNDPAVTGWSKGKFNVTLNPDETKVLAIAIDAGLFQ